MISLNFGRWSISMVSLEADLELAFGLGIEWSSREVETGQKLEFDGVNVIGQVWLMG